jgi:tRNA (Thr-GGU) A37 N-methylase
MELDNTHYTGLAVFSPEATLPSLVGVFATRSPVRPNPIGVTVVKLQTR